MYRREFLTLPFALRTGLRNRMTAVLRKHVDSLIAADGSVAGIKGKDAESLVAMSMEVAHGVSGESRYRRAAVQLSDRVLKRMRSTAFGVLPIKEKGPEKFIGGGPPALGWYAGCLGYVYHQAGGRAGELGYLAGVLDRFPWNPEGFWANTIDVATGKPKVLDRPTPMNKNAAMAMACAALSEYVRKQDAPMAERLRSKAASCLHGRILPAQQPDGYWHYGLTGRDPAGKEVLGYFMLGAGLLVRLRVLAPSFRTAELDRALNKAAEFAAKKIGPARFDVADEPKRGFDLAMLLVDADYGEAAEKIMNHALDHFPYGNRGQDGARCVNSLAALLLRP
jgi:hypothetical protein